MKKSAIFLLGFTFILAGCGGSSDEAGGTTSDSELTYFFTYKTADFEIQIPDDWEVLDAFDKEYPDELRVAFKNNETNTIFTDNVTVLREENTENDTSYDFAQRKLADHEGSLLNYKLLSQEIVNLQVGGAESKTILNTFEGKNGVDDPTLNFMQIYLTEGEKAWTVTASYREGSDGLTLEQMTTMLKSFTLR